jgi:hypothetical protein
MCNLDWEPDRVVVTPRLRIPLEWVRPLRMEVARGDTEDVFRRRLGFVWGTAFMYTRPILAAADSVVFLVCTAIRKARRYDSTTWPDVFLFYVYALLLSFHCSGVYTSKSRVTRDLQVGDRPYYFALVALEVGATVHASMGKHSLTAIVLCAVFKMSARVLAHADFLFDNHCKWDDVGIMCMLVVALTMGVAWHDPSAYFGLVVLLLGIYVENATRRVATGGTQNVKLFVLHAYVVFASNAALYVLRINSF